MKEELPHMIFKRDGETFEPLKVFVLEDKIIAVYQGSLSEYDILIKYREKLDNNKWSRIRTPKHIHWAVDLLIKMHSTNKERVAEFLDFLIEIWNKTSPIKNEEERKNALDIKNLLEKHKDRIKEYQDISNFGEYKTEFLILLAELLMIQEKTNMRDAYMFKELLDALREGKDIFKIVSLATHTGR